MNSFMLKCSKYTVAVIGFVLGTEILYRCIRRLYAYVKTTDAKENVYWKVIFFPDEGILSEGINREPLGGSGVHEETFVAKQNICLTSQNLSPEKIVHHNSKTTTDSFIITPAITSVPNSTSFSSSILTTSTQQANGRTGNVIEKSSSSSFVKPPPPPTETSILVENRILKSNSDRNKYTALNPVLQNSTSLIHMINVLESARRSLVVCVYLLSCSDLLEAIVRAKVRGVRVRVLLDKGMSSMSSVSSLLQNGIPIRYSKPAYMMHNKFAVVDAPVNLHSTAQKLKGEEKESTGVDEEKESTSVKNKQKNKKRLFIYERNRWIQKSKCALEQNAKVDCDDNNNNKGILMSGSFNWTWSGVVSNYENVIITNNHDLVIAYADEFEKLWNLFEFIPPRND